jgi:hypothetical protein
MGPNLPNSSFVKNDDTISILDGGETVRNDNGCPPFEQFCQALLD